jgi:UDP-N-acetylmuramate--alanine ligase
MSLVSGGRVHFVGIGGAGMSAIAKVLVERGISVSGSDLKRSRAATLLEAIGAVVSIGHDERAVRGAAVVVVSSAIRDSNPELQAARRAGIPVMTRGEALASLLKDQRSIVVAGTHGKTTTTSMIVSILRHADLDPTYLVGAGLNDSGTNARSGTGPFVVAESDESDGSFLLLDPAIAVVTNLEEDHVDRWDSLQELQAAFSRFVGATQADGIVIVPSTDPILLAAATDSRRRVVTFGPGGDVHATDLRSTSSGSSFTLNSSGGEVAVDLGVRGAHNVSNALCAAASALAADVSLDGIAGGLARYSGVERRFQDRGMSAGVTIVDDYAHHPTEVRATLGAAREGEWRRVVAVFQPHRYSRTQAFAAEFGDAFADADHVVLTDVYGAGEDPVPGVTGKLIADRVCASYPGRPVAYLPHRDELVTYLESSLRSGDLLLTMGAGDVTSLADELLPRLEARAWN